LYTCYDCLAFSVSEACSSSLQLSIDCMFFTNEPFPGDFY
jgi:hypothetical protein